MTILKSFEKPLTPEEELKYLTKFKEEQDDKLADGIRSHLDMERIYEIMKENVEEK